MKILPFHYKTGLTPARRLFEVSSSPTEHPVGIFRPPHFLCVHGKIFTVCSDLKAVFTFQLFCRPLPEIKSHIRQQDKLVKTHVT